MRIRSTFLALYFIGGLLLVACGGQADDSCYEERLAGRKVLTCETVGSSDKELSYPTRYTMTISRFDEGGWYSTCVDGCCTAREGNGCCDGINRCGSFGEQCRSSGKCAKAKKTACSQGSPCDLSAMIR